MIKIMLVVSAMMLNLAQSAPIELCNVSKIWGEASYQNKDNCNKVDLKLKANSFTIGGFSSGGYSTSNLFAMFNDNIDGVAINSGFGPCATQGYGCEGEYFPKKYNTTGIKGKPVFVYSGTQDPIVKHYTSQWTANYFESLGANVSRMYIPDFWHIFPNNVQTNEQYNPPSSCAIPTAIYNLAHNCGLDLAVEIFEYLYGGNMTKDVNYQDSGTLYAIDQTPYNTTNAFLADYGFLYVPNTCLNMSCRFHMDIHGCGETIVTYNDTFVRQLGYMEYAATHNIIMLFPQNDDVFSVPFKYCWRSSQQSDSKHPQIVGIGKLIEAVFGRDLLNLGVDPAERKVDNTSGDINDAKSTIDKQPMKLRRPFDMRPVEEQEESDGQRSSFLLF